MTSRRARKGFQLRYNPDFHWSNALYRGLDYIQLEDGSDITIVNRDDASGFQLDTLNNTVNREIFVLKIFGGVNFRVK